jgi:hypothetical protein
MIVCVDPIAVGESVTGGEGRGVGFTGANVGGVEAIVSEGEAGTYSFCGEGDGAGVEEEYSEGGDGTGWPLGGVRLFPFLPPFRLFLGKSLPFDLSTFLPCLGGGPPFMAGGDLPFDTIFGLFFAFAGGIFF